MALNMIIFDPKMKESVRYSNLNSCQKVSIHSKCKKDGQQQSKHACQHTGKNKGNSKGLWKKISLFQWDINDAEVDFEVSECHRFLPVQTGTEFSTSSELQHDIQIQLLCDYISDS